MILLDYDSRNFKLLVFWPVDDKLKLKTPLMQSKISNNVRDAFSKRSYFFNPLVKPRVSQGLDPKRGSKFISYLYLMMLQKIKLHQLPFSLTTISAYRLLNLL